MKGHRASKGIAVTFHDLCAWNLGGWLAPRSGHFTPRERPGTQCTGGLVDPRGQSGQVRKISPPTTQGFDPRTVPSGSESLYCLSYPGRSLPRPTAFPFLLLALVNLQPNIFPVLYPSTPILCITSRLYAYENGTASKFRNVCTKSSEAGRLPN